MQTGYNWPEYRADDDSHKQDKNDLMKAVKQPKAQTYEDNRRVWPTQLAKMSSLAGGKGGKGVIIFSKQAARVV